MNNIEKNKRQGKKINVITADDHSIITKSMAFIVKELYKDAVVYQLTTIEEVTEVLQSTAIDLLVLDISFPDGNPLNILPSLKKNYPGLKILIFSGHEEEHYALRCINAGANGYLSKLSTEAEIQNAICEVMDSGKYVSKNIQEKILKNYFLKKPINPMDRLTNREFEIAKLLASGYSNMEISNHLNLKGSTVSTYRNRVFEKLEIDSVADLIQLLD